MNTVGTYIKMALSRFLSGSQVEILTKFYIYNFAIKWNSIVIHTERIKRDIMPRKVHPLGEKSFSNYKDFRSFFELDRGRVQNRKM